MDKSSRKEMSFHSVPRENKVLATEIRNLVQKTQNARVPEESSARGQDPPGGLDGQLGAFLERLYVHICEFGLYLGNAATPDRIISAAWESFLDPINALTAVKPHGYMMAARMTLYLTQAYIAHGQLPRALPMSQKSVRPIAMRCSFVVSLDDLLLSCLAEIWTRSHKRELFKWVFTSYPVKVCACYHGMACQDYIASGSSVKDFHEQRRQSHIKTARITDPAGLTPENGIQPRRRWERAEGDTTQYLRHPDASRAGYEYSADGERILMWQEIGSDGPIKEFYRYSLFDEDTGEIHCRGRDTLRRSRQFILDARKIAECNLARDSRRMAQVMMARRSLPVELQLMVLEYLDDIQDPLYLGQLDLPAVYRPFPDISEKCRICVGRATNASQRMARATCPLKSITIWSLPLRAFHTLHQTSNGDWQLCPHVDCAGHHRDESWQSQNISIEDYLNSVLQSRCGQSLTLADIGMGPLEPTRLPSAAEDSSRERRLFSGFREDEDDNENREDRVEARWGGVAGLVGVMLHNETLLGLHTSGRFSTEPSWLLGRTRQEESRACAALARAHERVRCDFC